MFFEILKHTPSWVFVLFFVLIVLGYFQSRPRTVDKWRVFILPFAMIVLSFYGVIDVFGLELAGLLAWLTGVVTASWLGYWLALPKGVIYFDEARTFFIPGSWIPLILMMAIFFTKYAVGVMTARQPGIAGEVEFITAISLFYGLFSGLFFSRLLVIRQAVSKSCNNYSSE